MSTSGQAEEGDARWQISLTRLTTSLPGLVAASLAAIYTLGALLTMADLRGAGVRVSDALPFIPVTDLLARGIGLTVVALLVLLGLAAFAEASRRYFAVRQSTKREVLWWAVMMAIMFGALTVSVYAFPFVVTLGIAAGVTVLYVADVIVDLSGTQAIAMAYAVIVLGFAVNAIAAPQPLPTARLQLTAGTTVTGRLITSADSRWALISMSSGITVVPDADVKLVEIRPGEESGLHHNLQRFVGIAWWEPALLILLLLVLVIGQRWGPDLR